MEQPTLTTLGAKIEDLGHQSQTVIFLSVINMIMNVLTIAVGFLIGLS